MRSAVLALCAVLLWPAAAFATTCLVRPDGTGGFPTIQAAIHEASNGDVIELADGAFVGPGNRDVTYEGKALTIRSQSENPERCVIDCQGSPIDPHRGFDFGTASGTSRLEGLTVTNGYVLDGGGALLVVFTAPHTVNCIFRHNQAGSGGGVYVDGWATFEGCTFDGNIALSGAGFCI